MSKPLGWVLGIVLVALVLWGALHVFIQPVNPDQKTPEGHFRSACWACHFVSDSAEIQEP